MNIEQRRLAKMEAVMTLAHHDFERGLHTHSFFKVHELSDDLVQETFMKTWGYLVRGGKIDIMKAFLYHALNCLIIDEYRKSKTSSLDTLLEKGFEPGHDESEHVIDMLDGKTAFLLIPKLPKKYQDVLRMRYNEHLTLVEMAERTRQTKNSLSVQIHRGLERLKVLYEHT